MTEAVVTSHVVSASSILVLETKTKTASPVRPSIFYDSNFAACHNAEVRMRIKYCLRERKRLESECEKQADLLKARDEDIENLKAQLLLKEAEAAEAACLRV
nr:hypothetical protein [Tanacetum cinerariifolium]